MNWHDAKVLVTGAGGFIGSHLTERLVGLGAEAIAFVRYNSRGDCGYLDRVDPQVRSHLQIVRGDLRDSHALNRVCEKVDVIFHLGAVIPIPYSYIHPREVIDTNIFGTLNILLAAYHNQVSRVIHTSTSEVYGTAQYVPMDESHPLQGQSPYSASKIGADKLCESFYRSFDLPVVTIRPFNVYGPRQSARAVVPTIITQALTQDEIRIGSTTPTRDLTFVADTVSGFIRAADVPDIVGQVINLGSGNDISISELLELVMDIVGRPCRVATDPQRVRPPRSEVERLLADCSLANRLMGWKPAVSLQDGLRLTVDWIAQHLDEYRIGEYAL